MVGTPGEYVAVGSSFGAGPGLRPRAEGSPRPAGRSAVNYAHLLAARRGLGLIDVTYSGATTDDLLQPNGARPAQLDAVGPSTRLVTVTAGGNDIGYLGAITLSSLPRPLGAALRAPARVAEALDPSTMDARFETLRASLAAIVRRVHETAPDATIAFVDYLTIVPRDPGVATPGLDRQVADWARDVSARLSALFDDAAGTDGAVFVPVGAVSLAHHAWSADPWTRRFHYSLRGGAPYHPNAAGMRAVAELLDRTLPTP